MIFSCCGPDSLSNCEDKFLPVLTDMGICYALNPIAMKNSMKNTYYTKTFQKVFLHEKEKPDENLFFKVNKLSSFDLQITLDSHISKVCKQYFKN